MGKNKKVRGGPDEVEDITDVTPAPPEVDEPTDFKDEQVEGGPDEEEDATDK